MNDKTNWQTGADGWSVDLAQSVALHESGFRLDFNGHPSSRNFEVQPSGHGAGVRAVEWATMLRQGTDEYRRIFALNDISGGADNDYIDSADNAIDDDNAKHPGSVAKEPRKPVITVKRKRQIS